MNYKIVEIEGVGEVYAEKLIAAGIRQPTICWLSAPSQPDARLWPKRLASRLN